MITSGDTDQETQAEHAEQTDLLRADGEPTITVTEHGPYLVEGPVSVSQTDGTVLRAAGPWPRRSADRTPTPPNTAATTTWSNGTKV